MRSSGLNGDTDGRPTLHGSDAEPRFYTAWVKRRRSPWADRMSALRSEAEIADLESPSVQAARPREQAQHNSE